MFLEWVQSHGALTIGGIAGFFILALILMRLAPAELRATLWSVAIFVAGLLALGAASLLGPESAAFPFLSFVVSLLLGIAAIRLVVHFIFYAILSRIHLSPPRIVQDILAGIGYLIYGFILLNEQGVNLSSLIATSAVVTAVLAFSLQDTLGNILGGMAIQLDRSVSAGDWIIIDGRTGKVVDVHWRYTAVETRNWETIIIPNSQLVKNSFLVLGRRKGKPIQWRRWIMFNVDFRFPPAHVIETAERGVIESKTPRVALEPKPNCVVVDYAESYTRYALRYWLDDLEVEERTDSLVRNHIYAALKREGIPLSIPAAALFVTEETRRRRERKQQEEEERRMDVLSGIDIFGACEPEELGRLARRLKPAPFAAGDILMHQGDEADWLYLINSGRANILLERDGGQVTKVAEVGPGSCLGEMGLLAGEPRSATVVAETEVESYRLDKKSFQEILQVRPELAERISTLLAGRRTQLDEAFKKLDEASRSRQMASRHDDILHRITHFFHLDEL